MNPILFALQEALPIILVASAILGLIINHIEEKIKEK